jgi:SET domain
VKHKLRCGTYVDHSGVSGWGVYSKQEFCTGDLIEECVAIPVPYEVLSDYRMIWNDNTDCIATGNVLMLNHSDTPNVELVKDYAGGLLLIRALRFISPHEELFIKYACGSWW